MTTALRLAYNPNDVKPGWGALLLVLALGVVVYLLWRSLNTQLGRIQMPPSERRRHWTSFDAPPSADSSHAAPSTGEAPSDADIPGDDDSLPPKP
jgi:hypothetical protein